MKKKHQVFVSSTYEDLLDERKAISEAILECDCFPSGMELFPASNNKSWDIIKKVIDDSDYFLLVIAGRYGSTRRMGNNIISYTEMEYNYAVKTHKPILAFIYNGNISDLPFSKVDPDEATRQLLKKFREKVKNKGRQVAFWTDTPSLVSKVKQAVQTAIKETPSSGWIKCSDIGISGTDEECERLHDITKRWNFERIFRTRAEKNHESDPMLESHDIKKLDGIAFGLRSFRTSRERDVLKCLNNGATIRLLVMNPSSSFAIQRAKEEGEELNSIMKSINELVNWAKMLNNKSKKGKIYIKYYNSMTLDFYWRIDDVVYFGPYWFNTSSQQTITYKFASPGLGFNLYTDYFDNLWNNETLTTSAL